MEEEGLSTRQKNEGSPGKNEELSLEDLELESGDIAQNMASDDDEEVIELTDRIHGNSNEAGEEGIDMDTETLSFETPASDDDEEDIIELIDAVEPASDDEEIIELEDLVEEGPVEEDLTDVSALSVSDDDGDEVAPGIEPGLDIPEDGPTIPGADDTIEVEDLSEKGGVSTIEEMDMTQQAGTAPVVAGMEGVTEEKVEEIVIRVITEIVEKKADKILLEVAEAAVQKEIEKIKTLL